MNNDKYLPIGTVVLLKNATKKVMITGFCTMDVKDKTKIYDYSGCLYPEGVVNSNQTLLFNHEEIDKIFYMGFIDEEEKKFKTQLKELISSIEKNN